MKTFVFLLLLLNMSTAFADEPWAYCDGSKRAYLVIRKFVSECPASSSGAGELKRQPDAPDPELCTSRQVAVAVNHPELDYICAYPTAYETGDAAAKNTNRCINADAKYCQIGAGGLAGPGGHTIPADGWYHIRGSTVDFPDLRCQCGCFIGSTVIASPAGYTRIDALAEQSKAMPVSVLQFRAQGSTQSLPLRGPDFTVGPEEKPVIRITTLSGRDLTVTDTHPIFVVRADAMIMIQAKNLQTGDELMDENGTLDPVFALESFRLDLDDDKVYNLDTRSLDPEEHVIAANRLRVGDLYWQRRLSEESSRVDNVLNSAKNKG